MSEIITENLYEPRLRYPGRKGIYPYIVNYDLEFRKLETKPIIANDLDLTTEEGQALFNELIYSRYEGDVFTNEPRCPCGHTTGGEDEGSVCIKCGYPCESPTEQTIQPLVWMKPPEEVGVFMNIQVYGMLRAKMMSDNFSVLDWLIDPKYRPPMLESIPETLLREAKIKRGLKYFHDHFEEVLEKVFSINTVLYVSTEDQLTLKREDYDALIAGGGSISSVTRKLIHLIKPAYVKTITAFIEANRDVIFSHYLPFPSKIGFIIESVGSMKYIDPEMRPALNAMLSIAKADRECNRLEDAESRTARAIRDLQLYYTAVDKDKIYTKPGVARKLVFGMTPHFTFRSVITSEHLPHDHEVIKIPWGLAVLTFKLHIGNKLLKLGYTPNEWLTLIYDNVQRKHHLIDKIFDELIEESPGGRGPSCTDTRFPSLKHNSTTHFYIHVKRDPKDMSTSLSDLVLKASNSDFDGDYKSGMLAIDNKTARAFKRHSPYTGLMDHKVPYKVSDHCMIPHTVMSTINNMLEITDEQCKPYGG